VIRLNLSLTNPWHNDDRYPWRDLYQGEWQITKHTNLEVGVFFYLRNLFEFNLDIEWRGNDHAGPQFEIAILGLEFRIAMPDTRHWYYSKNRWINYDDPEEMRELYPENFEDTNA
jgi:hypothetical protein